MVNLHESWKVQPTLAMPAVSFKSSSDRELLSIHSALLGLTFCSKLDRFKKLKADNIIPPAKDNPLIFAFWTCLQLERYGTYASFCDDAAYSL
jgi:hypothetical protein